LTSDSPAAKTTKKTAKKTTQKKATQSAQAKKTPAKKAVKVTDRVPDLDQGQATRTGASANPNIGPRTPAPPVSTSDRKKVVDAVGSELDRLIGEARSLGVPALLGSCTVSLHFDV